MDILAYAAQKRAVELCNCLFNYSQANTNGYIAGTTNLNSSYIPFYCGCYNGYNCYQALGRESLDKTPWCYCNWVSIPTFYGGNTSFAGIGVNGFQVCSTSVGTVGSGGGACCLFTVPSGISYVRFQMWGAGGNAGSGGLCCGGSGFGSTGAYASVILPAFSGCQYTLCAGSVATTTVNFGTNYNNYTCQSNASFVTGYGLNNVCAIGGRGFSPKCILVYDISAAQFLYSCRYAAPDCGCSGACICNGGNDYCFAGTCASCGCIPFSKTNTTGWCGTNTLNINCSCSITNCSFGGFWWGQVVGINGMNGSDCFDTEFCGLKQHPPIYGYESVSRCVITGSGTTAGGMCCNGCVYDFMRYPGAGGSGVFLYGGCIASCSPGGSLGAGGDIGRGGMVCVSYC
jgi:hypothetical protein